MVLLTVAAALSFYAPPLVNPATYLSPSQVYQLDVDPTEPDGSGAARYRLTHRGSVAWESELPFTWYDAVVTDDGVAAGVAYSRGIMGGPYGEEDGDLRFVVLDPTGEVRFERTETRTESRAMHSQPVPQSRGVLLDTSNGRVVLRWVSDGDGKEEWFVYDVESGETRASIDPITIVDGHLIDIRALPGKPYFLAHWGVTTGSRFVLLSHALEAAWQHSVESEPTGPSARIASVDSSGFSIEHPSTSTVTVFEVTPTAGAPVVLESDHRPMEEATDALTSVPEVSLSRIGAVALGRGASDEVVRQVFSFDIDARGRFGFAQCASGSALVLVDTDGRELARSALDLPRGVGCPHVAWLRGDVWALALADAENAAGSVLAVDMTSGRTRVLAELQGSYTTSFRSGGGDGLFVLQPLEHQLQMLDVGGTETLRLPTGNYEDERALFSPEDVSSLPGGGFAVVDNLRHVIQLFSATGSYIRRIELEASLGHAPHYPAEIAVSPSGTFAVWDFGAKKPLLLLDAGGVLVSEHAPTFEDGRQTGRLRSLRFAPDGALWASDGAALLEVDADGIVRRVVGSPPTANELTEIGSTGRDRHGNYYLLDRRTGSLHVYDAEGAYSHRCDPAPNDFDDHVDFARVTISGDGTVYLANEAKDSYLVFDATGRRMDERTQNIDTIAEDWYAHPEGQDLWITTMDELYLTDANGAVLQRVRRHSDRTWLDAPRAAAVASDGRVALLTGTSSFVEHGTKLGMFNTDGSAAWTRSFPTLAPFAAIAFDADALVIGMEDRLYLIDGDGDALARLLPDVDYDQGRFDLFLVAHGDELQLLSRDERTVYRYDLTGLH